ncbi:UDP-glucose 4-epimerase GalE [Helicobacter sp. 13S00477-4]|uniref:UDP-glucose 4-epimerase GalE n=1 Tax=Helicobacter sp. 13S00477-4 TaxID=1905759 RepID=UPI000BA72DAA|nr:UDP-glucose 4-epimerase GalE [Helicobacter sp. 13S00477-4]PAF52248.1 UDP-glucose 4-epimerase GalE [Helicobacter sp. 13S00477-4]
MELLLTGGSGYIGSHTGLEFLTHTTCNITIIDNLSTGFIENQAYLKDRFPNRVHFIQADLSDTPTIEKILKNTPFDCILHFSGSLIVNESVINPLLYYTNNTCNTISLIKLCVQYQIKNFIFSSTAAVYGEPEASLIPVVESLPLKPINPYGNSKMMLEQVLKDCSMAYDLNYVALRYFNVAGASMQNNLKTRIGLGQRSKNATHLIKIACEYITKKRTELFIFGDDYPTFDGTCIRDYIHIDDLANAHLQAYYYLKEHKKSQIFNVGYGIGYSVKEVLQTLKEISKIDFEINITKRRDGDPAILISNNQKILSHTNWKPKYNDLNTIIKSSYEWEKFFL